MSNRRNEFKTESKNPAKKFLEWKSNDKTFMFYNKETQEKEMISLPLKLLVLKEMHTIKGFDEGANSGIYSNEVKLIGSEEITVRNFSGGMIAKGLYKDVKEQIRAKGGHYSKSIYAMLETGEIINIQLKGAAVQKWGEFTQKTRSRLTDEWITITGAEDRKKGAVKYTVPIFEFSGSLSDHQNDLADESYDNLESYMSDYKNQNEPTEDEIVADEVEF